MNIDNKIKDDWSCTFIRCYTIFMILGIPECLVFCTNIFRGLAVQDKSVNSQLTIGITQQNAPAALTILVLDFLGVLSALPFCRTGNVEITLGFFVYFVLVSLLGLVLGVAFKAWAFSPVAVVMMILFAWKYSNNRPANA